MSYQSLLTQLKTLLIADAAFKKKVSVWDYSILDLAIDPALVLLPGPMTETISSYGAEHSYATVFLVEVYSYYTAASSTDTCNNLLSAIDTIRDIIRENVHLGLTVSEVESTRILSVTRPETWGRKRGTIERMRATIAVQVIEPEWESGSAQ